MEGEPKFIDGDTHYQSGKDEALGFNPITMGHLRHIMQLGSKELRGGWWREASKKNEHGITTTHKVYEPDSREEFCRAVNMLHLLLWPKIETENSKKTLFQDIKKELKKAIKEIDSARKECLGRTKKNDSEILPTEHYGKEDREVLETYKHRNLRLHEDLFRELNRYLNLKNYFVTTGLEE